MAYIYIYIHDMVSLILSGQATCWNPRGATESNNFGTKHLCIQRIRFAHRWVTRSFDGSDRAENFFTMAVPRWKALCEDASPPPPRRLWAGAAHKSATSNRERAKRSPKKDSPTSFTLASAKTRVKALALLLQKTQCATHVGEVHGGVSLRRHIPWLAEDMDLLHLVGSFH